MARSVRNWTGTGGQGKYGTYERWHSKYNFGTAVDANGEVFDNTRHRLTKAEISITSTESGSSSPKWLFLRAGHSKTGTILGTGENNDWLYTTYGGTKTFNLLKSDGTFWNNSVVMPAIISGQLCTYVANKEQGEEESSSSWSTFYRKFTKIVITLEWVNRSGSPILSQPQANVGVGGDTLGITIDNFSNSYYYKAIVSEGNSWSETYNLGQPGSASQSINFGGEEWRTRVTNGLFANRRQFQAKISIETYKDASYTELIAGDMPNSADITLVGVGLEAPTISIGNGSTTTYSNSGIYNKNILLANPGYGTCYMSNIIITPKQGSQIARIEIVDKPTMIATYNEDTKLLTIFVDLNTPENPNGLPIEMKVTDTRGLSGTVNASVKVQRYSPPKLTITNLERTTTPDGKKQIYFKYSVEIAAGYYWYSENGRYPWPCLTIKNDNGQTLINQLELSSYEYTTSFPEGITEVEYEVSITMRDNTGTRATAIAYLPSEEFYLFFGADDTVNRMSLGIGGAAPAADKTVRCHWNLELDEALPVTSGGTGASTVAAFREVVADLLFPVGAIYMTTSSSFDPATNFGGTWTLIEDRFLLGASATHSVNSQGGAAEHTLTMGEMPRHSHSMWTSRVWGSDYPMNNWTSPVRPGDSNNLTNAILSTTYTTGESEPFSIMPPYLAVYIWKRTA